MKKLTKQEAIEKAGGAAELARLMGITHSAVCQWEGVIPDGSQWKLFEVKPDWFEETQEPELAEKKKEA